MLSEHIKEETHSVVAITAEHIPDQHPDEPRMEKLDEVQIHPSYPNHKVQIRAGLIPELKEKVIDFLAQQHDCFSWSHSNMTGINPEVTMHRLQIYQSYPQVNQKRRKFAPKRNHVINEEV